MRAEATFESSPDDGLYEVLLRAAKVASETTDGVVGILEVRLDVAAGSPSLDLEAEFAWKDGRRVIDELAVRVSSDLDGGRIDVPSVLRDGLRQFGSTAFTNVSATVGEDGDSLDVTVAFGSRIPWLASNLLLPLASAENEALTRYESVLTKLGVSHRRRASALEVSRHQLRRRVEAEEQAGAYEVVRLAAREVSLYASALPATQAFRIEERGPPSGRVCDVALSRGFSARYVCSSKDALEMQSFAARHFGVAFGARGYHATNLLGEGPAVERAPVFAGSARNLRRDRPLARKRG